MRRWALFSLALAACRGAPPPPAVGPPPAPAVVAPVEAAPPADEALRFDRYRQAFIRELSRVTRARLVAEHREASAPREVVVLKRIGQAEAFVVSTVGFGRQAHDPKSGSRVELIAYVEEYGPNIGSVLSALGVEMHRQGEAAPWQEYELVRLPGALFGLQHFDLRPAGEVDLPEDSAGSPVSLWKAVPLSVEEFERAQRNPSGEWDDPSVNARMVQRWRRALEKR